MKRFLLGLLALGVSTAVFAKNCSYESFTPQFLASKILYDFNQAGLGQINFRSTDEKGMNIVKTTLVRDTGAVGVVELQMSPKETENHFVIRDNRSRTLLSVVQQRKGVSRTEIEFYSDFATTDFPFLTILHFPTQGTYHYVGVKDEGITMFYIEFERIWNKAKEILLNEQAPNYYFFKSPRERFLFRAQNNPSVSPYVELLHVRENGKHFVVSGLVPSNGIYSQVLHLAQQEFGLSVRVDLVIDERIRVPELVKPVCKN